MAEKEGRLIPFEPNDNDIVSTRLRTWTCKHPGTLAYYELINEYVHKLPPSGTNSKKHALRVSELATRIYEITTIERRGRFLKLLDDKLLVDNNNGTTTKPTKCVLLSQETIMEKIKYGLIKKQRKLSSRGSSNNGKSPGRAGTTSNKNKSTKPPTTTSTSSDAAPVAVAPASAKKTYGEQICQEVANLKTNSTAGITRSSSSSSSSSSSTTTKATSKSPTTTPRRRINATDSNDLVTFPAYVYNQRKAIVEIEEFVEGLVESKQCSCNYSWCYLWRPHYLFAFNPDMKHHLVNTIIAFHCQSNPRGLIPSSTQVSQWFVKANKYRLVLTLDGDCTIHLCKNGLCRILGLTTPTDRRDFDTDQRILVYMKKKHSSQQQSQQSQSDDIDMEANYEDFVSSSENIGPLVEGPVPGVDGGADKGVSFDYFRTFWKVNSPNVLAGLWVDQNSRQSLMDNFTSTDTFENGNYKRKRNGSGGASLRLKQQQQQEQQEEETTTTKNKPAKRQRQEEEQEDDDDDDDEEGEEEEDEEMEEEDTTENQDHHHQYPQQRHKCKADYQHWMSKYRGVEAFYQENGKAPTKKTDRVLFKWIKSQKQAIRRSPNSPQQCWKIDLFAKVGVVLVDLDPKPPQKQQQQQHQQIQEEEDELLLERTAAQSTSNNETRSVTNSSSAEEGWMQVCEDRWTQKWELLKEFLEENNGSRPTAKTNNQLFVWLTNQRSDYKRSPNKRQSFWKRRVAKMAELGIDVTITLTKEQQKQQEQQEQQQQQQQQPQSQPQNDERWMQKWELLKEFLEENNGVRPTAKTNNQLYIWLMNQPSDYKKSPNKHQIPWTRRVAKLAELGIDVTKTFTEQQQQHKQQQQPQEADERWMEKWGLLKDFMEQNSGVRPTAKSSNQLYIWLMNQPFDYKRSPNKHQIIWTRRVAKLAELGIDVTKTFTEQQQQPQEEDERWMQKWGLLKNYMEQNNGLRPTGKTNNQLYTWLMNQRSDYKRSPNKDQMFWKRRLAKLEELGIDISTALKEQQQQHPEQQPGHEQQPQPQVQPQEQQQEPRPQEGDERWMQKWGLLKDYMEQHNGFRPTGKTNNQLYTWLMNQRSDYRRSPNKHQITWTRRLAKLEELGIDITTSTTGQQQHPQQEPGQQQPQLQQQKQQTQSQPQDDERWIQRWESLKEFLEESNGVRPTAKTNNQLYVWLMSQRSDYKRSPTKDQIFWKQRVAKMAEVGIDITKTAMEEQLQQRHRQYQDQDDDWMGEPAAKKARTVGGGKRSVFRQYASKTSPVLASVAETAMFGTQNKAVRRISMDGGGGGGGVVYNNFYQSNSNNNKGTVELLHPPQQRPSIASLNRRYKIQKRKARFIRRAAFHPVSKLSQL